MYSSGKQETTEQSGNTCRTVYTKEACMKHVRLIARARDLKDIPSRAATGDSILSGTALQVKVDFLVELTDRVIRIIMQGASGL